MDVVSSLTKPFQAVYNEKKQGVTANAEQNPKDAAAAATSVSLKSRRVSGGVHRVKHNHRHPQVANILRKETEEKTFTKITFDPPETPSADDLDAYKLLQKCLEMRNRYVFRESPPWEKKAKSETKSDHYFVIEDGVVQVYANKDSKEKLFPVPDATTFFNDLDELLKIVDTGEVWSVCDHRLGLLEEKAKLHVKLNLNKELRAQKTTPNRDFYNVRKVDTHVHHSACMSQLKLLNFIKSKLIEEPDEVVLFSDDKYMTLQQVFDSLDLPGHDLDIDLLDVHGDDSTFHRFDEFNLKYNPFGQSKLRQIFLKHDNYINGRYLAELTKQVFTDLETSKYQMAEYRISVHGTDTSEWDVLASWVLDNDLCSKNVVWLIQLPRLYDVYKKEGEVDSYGSMLEKIFLPLFEVTVNPESNPKLHTFLEQVVGFDLVDDESKPDPELPKPMRTPEQWNDTHNPPYSYYTYYFYANLYTLNKLRDSKGMTTIRFRPHCGEAGDTRHLAAAFLTVHNISHGINLRLSLVLQYLYYLAQIGLAVSPLSNNSLFLDYEENPFPNFLLKGLNVSLSTDDPLIFHLTDAPLVEEYTVATSVWKLSKVDVCEIARNSLYQSGFSHEMKSHWMGPKYYKRGPDGNDIRKTNVPYIRLEFRDMMWREEMQEIYQGKAKIPEYIETCRPT